MLSLSLEKKMTATKFKNQDVNKNIRLKDVFLNLIKFCKSNHTSLFCIGLFLLLVYGIKLFYYSISIDSEILLNNYDSMLNSFSGVGRFGIVALKRLLMLYPFNPYFSSFLMICAIFLFSVVWGYLLCKCGINANQKLAFCIFSVAFITHPNFAEQFNFIMQGFEVASAVLFCGLSVLLISDWIIGKGTSKSYLFLGLLLMVLSFGTYQAIMSLYISGATAFFILYYHKNECIEKKKSQWKVPYGIMIIKYIYTFIIGVVAYYIIDKIVLKITNASTKYLSSQFTWGKISIRQTLKNIFYYIKDIIWADDAFSSRIYLLVAAFLIVYALYHLIKKHQNAGLLLAAVLLLLFTPFLLATFIGSYQAPRTQFSLQFISAFGLFFAVSLLKDRSVKILLILFCFLFSFMQSQITSKLFYSDYMRYQQDVSLANSISQRIDYLTSSETPAQSVVFVGAHPTTLAPYMVKGNVIGCSFFEWDMQTPYGCTNRAVGFMKTLGIEYHFPTLAQVSEAKQIATKMPVWPNKDSIKVSNDVIVVKLSN